MLRPGFTKQHAAALAGSLGLLALALLFYHSLAGGTLLQPNAYDSYLLQAQNWLAGRSFIQNGESYPWLELAIFHGKYYLSFPPVPSVLALPFAALGLSVSNLVQALYALLALAGVYLCFWQQHRTPQHCAEWAVFFTLGSNFFWLACSGGVWMQAQALNLCLAVWGAFFYLRRQEIPAFFMLALAVGCRPFSVLLAGMLFLRPLIGYVRQKRFARLAAAAVLPLAVGLALAWYNLARFGSPFEFGHNYLPEFMREANGQFHFTYLVQNLKNLLRPVTLTSGLDLSFPLFNGFLPFAASPVFLVLAARLAQAAKKRELQLQDALLLAGLLASLLALCSHRTFGGWQFGARYTVDLLPWVLLLLLRRPGSEPGGPPRFLCAAGVLFNFYGAAYMLNH